MCRVFNAGMEDLRFQRFHLWLPPRRRFTAKLNSSTRSKNKRDKDRGEKAQKGTARRTLRAAYFFYDQAGRVEHKDIEDYGYYVEAAVVFSRMVLEHLASESNNPKASQFIANQVTLNPLLYELKEERNFISHQRSIAITSSSKDVFYFGEASSDIIAAHEKLNVQLGLIEKIVEECEKRYS